MPIRSFAATVGHRLLHQRELGFLGSLIVVIGSWSAGAVPAATPGSAIALLRHPDAGLVAVYFGVILLLGAWIRLGRDLAAGARVTLHGTVVTFGWWAAPLLAGPAMFSRDVYSYLAQGATVLAGADVYTAGVAGLGGPLAAEVPAMWLHSPPPYGPLAIGLSVIVAAVTGKQVMLGVLGMRLVALLGVGLLLRFLPELARHCGVSPVGAVWLAVLNPLALLHLVGGAHNDAVMLGLLVAGLTLALRGGHPVLAPALITGAGLVKVPALAGLLVCVWLWRKLPTRGEQAWTALRTAAVVATTTLGVTALVGTGFGWIGLLGSPVSAQSWSLSSAVGRLARNVLTATGSAYAASAIPATRWLFLALFVVSIAALWLLRHWLGPVLAIGLGLGAFALLGPVTRPWYALWGVVIVAAASAHPVLRWWCAGISAGLALLVLPSGFGPDGTQLRLAAGGVALATALFAAAAPLSRFAAKRGFARDNNHALLQNVTPAVLR
ncbi:hypothetical protein F4553_001319 [Allocatelliglobosispora scoriae]|uniref:DUF2029 domain-containing protein n=1 Tax=Allocatelliglobosispora scoriae TaxID=643052 RepID=A0A841BM91_9ACTN|nr:polyprenol phosphomannose-dependent alpha 1,6 mannosyltransferase MptB [Allocatelliglobosispora scoriae]MBB5867940.1 hypothetical protein [Allocatelliglobosispora scoriae]